MAGTGRYATRSRYAALIGCHGFRGMAAGACEPGPLQRVQAAACRMAVADAEEVDPDAMRTCQISPLHE